MKYATPQELLSFCNKVRAVGDADILPALTATAGPYEANSCPIASNLNFGCEVQPIDPQRAQTTVNGVDVRDVKWALIIEDEALVRRIAIALDLEQTEYRCWHLDGEPVLPAVVLPREIGNAAAVCDAGADEALNSLVVH